jgi:hypothetical protein
LKGGGRTEEFNPDAQGLEDLKHFTNDAEYARGLKAWIRKNALNQCLNMQRVDILLE